MSDITITGLDPFSTDITTGTYQHGVINAKYCKSYSSGTSKTVSRPGVAVNVTLGYRGVSGQSKVIKCNTLKYFEYAYQPLVHDGEQASGFQLGTVIKKDISINIKIADTYHKIRIGKKTLEGVQFSIGEKITIYQPRLSPLEWSPDMWNGQGR